MNAVEAHKRTIDSNAFIEARVRDTFKHIERAVNAGLMSCTVSYGYMKILGYSFNTKQYKQHKEAVVYKLRSLGYTAIADDKGFKISWDEPQHYE